MSFNTNLFSSLTRELNTRAARALVSTWSPYSQALRKYLLETLETPPGSGTSFLADPVFEIMFPWQPANTTMQQLVGNLLHPATVKALDEANKEQRFAAHYSPHAHQLEAWLHLMQPRAQSVIVSSGTGSGKTEAFMIPVIDDLVREAEQHGPLTGVRALFLYPLNALIANQRQRLGSWLEGMHGNVRYCLYNGNTPEEVSSLDQRKVPHEVLSRKVLRENPPPIVVTNPTMLEYMLVRQDDDPIIKQSQGTLRWIILDEAHTYVGSQAAELSLLLRRVLHTFGRQAKDVRFVATSATMSSDGADADDELRNFLADIAGVDPEQVQAVKGARRIPEIPAELMSADNELPADLRSMKSANHSDRYRRLASSSAFRKLRQELSERAISLSDASKVLSRNTPRSAQPITNDYTLTLFDVARGARLSDDSDALLPLRAHLFMRAQPGVWACVNKQCSGRTETLQDKDWGFGAVFFTRRTSCQHCNAKVFELVLCSCCGAHYLEANHVSDAQGIRLEPTAQDFEHETELLPEVQAQYSDDNDDIEPELDELSKGHQSRRLIGYWSDAFRPGPANINLITGELKGDDTISMIAPQIKENSGNRLACNRCGEQELDSRSLFRPLRSGAPSMLSVAIPTLLEHTPDATAGANTMPYQGRQTITFTDSRHATAAFSLRTQQTAERNFLRSWVYHELWQKAHSSQGISSSEIEEKNAKLHEFEKVGAAEPDSPLHSFWEDLKTALENADKPPSAELAWSDAVKSLKNTSQIKQMMEHWRRVGTFRTNDYTEAAEFLLIREFMSRPMRQNSMESMGLVHLDYPWIAQRINQAPPDWTRLGQNLESWRLFLKVVLTYYVRNVPAVAIDPEMARWIGMRHRSKFLLPPDDPTPDKDARRKYQRWPLATRSMQSRLVRLLALVLNRNLDDYSEKQTIDEILRAAWDDLTRAEILKNPTGEKGYQLKLDATHSTFGPAVTLNTLQEGWLCPVTSSVLDAALDGLTYFSTHALTRERAKCKKIEMPRPPRAICGTATLEENAKVELFMWLNDNPEIQQLREIGVWSEHNDRVASWSSYFNIAEHSAQQTPHILQTYEEAFREKDLNVLSCSTTMEMGVDIGGLMSVAMNNAPPAPANYRQRAGRAGRRGETAAIAFTLCQSSPHGEAIFNNPLWPFTTHVSVPRVALESERIVQRHINALLLTRYLKNLQLEGIRIEAGWFFEPDERDDAQVENFYRWIQSTEILNDEWVISGIQALITRSSLKNIEVEELLRTSCEMLKAIETSWRSEYDALCASRKDLPDDSSGAHAVDMQLERLKGEYLLGYLASSGYLPGYGFPTGIVPFINTNYDDIKKKKETTPGAPKKHQEQPGRRKNYPSRPMPLAIRNYAPGNSVIINNKIYESRGISLNWRTPARDEQVREIQALGWMWRCTGCGNVGRSSSKITTCDACGMDLPHGSHQRLLTPAGFAIDLGSKPHSNLVHTPFVPVLQPLISTAGAIWVPLVANRIGRHRASNKGRLIHYSSGANNAGYAICLQCGFTASEDAADQSGILPDLEIMLKHRPLRGGKQNKIDDKAFCKGIQNPFAIQRSIHLGGEETTDVFELQLFHPDMSRPLNEIEATSLAIALRDALCRKLGIETREVGYAAPKSRFAGGNLGYSVVLFDASAGGAGYATQTGEYLTELLEEARRIADCHAKCDAACHSCLLEFDTQHDINKLNRHTVLELLSDTFLHELKLPDDLQFFGKDSRYDNRLAIDAINRTLDRAGVRHARFYLGADSADWSWWEWPVQQQLHALIARRVCIELVISQQAYAKLPVSIALALANFLEHSPSAELSIVRAVDANDMRVGEGYLLAEIGEKDQCVRWAMANDEGLAANENWGEGPESAERALIMVESNTALSPLTAPALSVEQLRPLPTNTLRVLEIKQQLNGSIDQFGSAFWQLIARTFSQYEQLLQSHSHIASITYRDRYVQSPWVFALLYRVIEALAPDDALTRATLTIRTERPDSPKQQRTVLDKWTSHVEHDSILLETFKSLTKTCNIQVFDNKDSLYKKHRMPHERSLTIQWFDGTTMKVHLDQGFGFLKPADSQSLHFDFHASPAKQAENIQALSLAARIAQSASYFYVFSPQKEKIITPV